MMKGEIMESTEKLEFYKITFLMQTYEPKSSGDLKDIRSALVYYENSLKSNDVISSLLWKGNKVVLGFSAITKELMIYDYSEEILCYELGAIYKIIRER